MELGIRVIRGPDWTWNDQDDGDGHVGTVVEIGKPGSGTSPDKTVVTQWDSGSRTNYRVGYQNAYDLRVFDNAPIGVRHPNIICDDCRKQGIQGMRWKCTKCHDFDLCTQCYMADKHDLSHSFIRYHTADSSGTKLPKRCNAVRTEVKGVFPGAQVVRGPDWDWGNQDGKEGNIGKVVDIRGWDSESGGSVANVTWSGSGSTNVYRMGHKGKVDLKYIPGKEGLGGMYYKEHLPVLGEDTMASVQKTACCQYKVGDKVRVDLDMEVLKEMQDGHGGWNPKMAEFVGKIGTVHRITEKGDVRVSYEGSSNRWTFHAAALTKVHQYSCGDLVLVSTNTLEVAKLQKGHGEWTDNMRATLGKKGRIMKIYQDGDLRVMVDKHTWTFSPKCVSLVPHGSTDLNNTMADHEREEPARALTMILQDLLELQDLGGPDRLVREAAQGHVDAVKELVARFPDKVDQKSAGKTALQVASHQGNVEIVRLLLKAGAKLELKDDDGDTALHYSAFGNQPDVAELLLTSNAPIDVLNNGGCSTLHVAVNKQHLLCVEMLLKHKCNINIQDSYGDTALHDAISKDNKDIINLLVNISGIDFTLRNKRGFNVLHHAALKGNAFATSMIVTLTRQIVDVKKDDGFSALHLAALNGHKEVTDLLLAQGRADIEITNNRRQTPLLLAVSQGHTSLIELLVTKGADVNVCDEDGDTCLHLALMRQSVAEGENVAFLATIRSQLGMTDEDGQTGAAIACYLAQQGADLTKKNNQNKTPLDVTPDARTEEIVKQFALQHALGNTDKLPPSLDEPVSLCKVCDEEPASIIFDPCEHKIVCAECCVRMKKCLDCGLPINKKISAGGKTVEPGAGDQFGRLQRRMQELEDTIMCSICLDRNKNIAFLCGHGACQVCAQPLKSCHMCRKPITKRINLFH